ncbi:hypothetical protein LLH23_00210 [bacterium]|nr:hypothetical protein [bacterium]
MSYGASLLGGFLQLPRRAPRRRPDGDWLLQGARPRPGDIDAHAEAFVGDIQGLFLELTLEGSAGGLHLLTGRPGSGRSTLLLRLGRQLAAGKSPVFLYQPGLGTEPLDHLLGKASRRSRAYLLIDDIHLCPEAETILYEIDRAGADILVIGTTTVAEEDGDSGLDGLALLQPATLRDMGVRHAVDTRAGDPKGLAAALRVKLPSPLPVQASPVEAGVLASVRGLQQAVRPEFSWERQALPRLSQEEGLLGVVLAGLAELAVPKDLLTGDGDEGRVKAWLADGLVGLDGPLLYPPHSEICCELLAALEPDASQVQGALVRLLDAARGDQAVFAPQLLARLALTPQTTEVARGEIAQRGAAGASRSVADPVGLAWQMARQVAGLDADEPAEPGSYAPELALRLQATFAAGQTDLALDLATCLAEDHFYRTCGQYSVSLLHARQGDWEAARAAAPQARPLLPQTSFLLGLLHEECQDYEAAIASYKAAIEDQELTAAAVRHLGRVHLKIGAPRAALRLFEAALSQNPTDASLYAGVAVAHLQLGAVDAARSQADRAVRAGVSAEQARRAIARGFSEVRAYSHAAHELERCLKDTPTAWEARRELAEALCEMGDFAREEEELRRVIAVAADDAAAQLQMARCLRDQDRAEDAWETLGALEAAHGGSVATHLLAAEIAGVLGRPRAQRRAAEAALALGDGSGWGLLWLARSRAALGQDDLVGFMEAATALHRGLSDDLPPRDRARLWEALLVIAVSLHDSGAVSEADGRARREARLCAATSAKIDSVIAGRALPASSFISQLDELQQQGADAVLSRPLSEEEPEAQLVGIALSPPATAVLQAGERVQFAAVAQYDDGTTEDVTGQATWEWTGDEAAGTVTADGLFTAGEGCGVGLIVASYEQWRVTSGDITVRNAVGLELSPVPATGLSAGATVQLAALLRYGDDATQDVTAQATWEWRGEAAVGAISAEGVFTAGEGCGVGQVLATYGEWCVFSGDITVSNVVGLELSGVPTAALSAGATVQLAARLRYGDGTTEDVTEQAVWQWTGAAEAGAISAEGVFTAGEGCGVGQVLATYGEWRVLSGEITVSNVVGLELSPVPATALSAGATVQLMASLRYGDDTTQDVTAQATWEWRGEAVVGAISAEGVFTAGEGCGVGQVLATYGEWRAVSGEITVSNVAGLELSPVPATALSAGATVQLAALLRYGDDTTEDVTEQAVWAWTGAAEAGAVSAEGLFTAGEGCGSGQVLAAYGDWRVFSGEITVSNVVGLELSPVPAAALSAGATVQLAALLRYGDGATEDVTTEATWEWRGEAAVGAVSAEGVFTAGEGCGVGQVLATYGEWRVFSGEITVSNVVGLELSPVPAAALSAGATVQLAALLRYGDDTTEDVTAEATWEWTGAAEGGAVSAEGLFTAGEGCAVGQVLATYGEWRVFSGEITVSNVVGLELSAVPATALSAGATVQLAALLRYGDGTTEDVTTEATWEWRGEVAVGAVSAEGLFTAGEGCGVGQVLATYGEWRAVSGEVTVSNVVGLELSDVPATALSAGATVQLMALLRYGDGTTEDVTEQAVWEWAGAAEAGAVSAEGLFTAGEGCGVGQVRATYGEWSVASDDIAVRNTAGLELNQVPATPITIGATAQLTALLRYTDGETEDVTAQATWEWTGAAEAVTVSAEGLLAAGEAAGVGQVVATYEQWRVTSDEITVREPAWLVVRPTEPVVLCAGQSVRLRAALQHPSGEEEEITEGVTWRWQGDKAAGTLDPDGLFTAGEGCGTGKIVAMFETQEAYSEPVEISNIALLVLMPSEVLYLEPGEMQRFSAALKYTDGTLGNATNEAEWSWTGPEGTGAITAPGILTAGPNSGEGKVVVTYAGNSDESGHILVRSLVALHVSPAEGCTLTAGETCQFSVTAEYGDGYTEDVTALATWEWTGPDGSGWMSRGALLTTAAEWSGQATVTASYKNQTAASGVIEVRRLVALHLEPGDEIILEAGMTQVFRLLLEYEVGKPAKGGGLGGLLRRGRDTKGKQLLEDVTGQAEWRWKGDPRSGEISAPGQLTAGDCTDIGKVTATYGEGRVSSAAVTIRASATEPPPQPSDQVPVIRERLARLISERHTDGDVSPGGS